MEQNKDYARKVCSEINKRIKEQENAAEENKSVNK